MAEGVLLDNDVVLKICCYQSSKEMLSATTFEGMPPAILAVARFALLRRVARSKALVDHRRTQAVLEELLDNLRIIEPKPDEIEIAADLEQQALDLSLEFDTGESQLFAVLLRRGARLMVTGDKRALCALEQIAPTEAVGCLACLEQLMATIVVGCDHLNLRSRICREPAADRAITACFSCSAPTTSIADIVRGLQSYIADVRCSTMRLLLSSDDLSAIVSQKDCIGGF
jgi:hypothetical protein